jgi:hypothetical protein
MMARVSARLSRIRAHSCLGILHNSSAHHPQVAQGEQRVQLLRVLHQPTVAHLEMDELALGSTMYLGLQYKAPDKKAERGTGMQHFNKYPHPMKCADAPLG